MPHPYSTVEELQRLVGADTATALLDLDEDDAADSGVYADAQERADAEIDLRLGGRFVVPFAGDPTADADLTAIQMIATHLCAGELYLMRHPNGAYHLGHRNKALELLKALLEGEAFLDAPLRDGDDTRVAVAVDAADPVFSSRDEYDVDRMAGW